MYNPVSVPGGISYEKVALIVGVFLVLFVLRALLEKYFEKRSLKKED
ncbi:MAG: hypothetical protein H0Z18_06745 [Thermococcus sp.]|nr:hypothetical protein [Thermococcus sp.]MBO8174940.1 hypothetical protein [Thermococcus sp.]